MNSIVIGVTNRRHGNGPIRIGHRTVAQVNCFVHSGWARNVLVVSWETILEFTVIEITQYELGCIYAGRRGDTVAVVTLTPVQCPGCCSRTMTVLHQRSLTYKQTSPPFSFPVACFSFSRRVGHQNPLMTGLRTMTFMSSQVSVKAMRQASLYAFN